MPRIRILPEHLANRIAAGEVVERPASVVKELVENSIDAEADRIEVEIESGGTRLIRVIDNGLGMDEDDILLSFERHGTSKITEDHELDSISTLGFRGEAIPSIASVSRMSIISRPQNSPLGTKVEFDYGRLQKVHETGSSQGTIIEVRNLFGRTPARKKFLRTKRTELGHIDDIIKNYGLACPETAFSLRIDGKETISLAVTHNLEERLRIILNYRDELITIDSPSTGSGLRRLHGYLVPPEKSLPGAARMRLFINGRAIKDRLMHHAVIEGLRGFLLKGHSPAGYLHLELPPEEVDVNVHPAKLEVRFLNSKDIHQFIKQNIEHAMQDYQQTLRSHFINPQAIEADEIPVKQHTPSSARQLQGSLRALTTMENRGSYHNAPRQHSSKNNKFPHNDYSQPVFEDAGSISPRASLCLKDPHDSTHDSLNSSSPFHLPEKTGAQKADIHHSMHIIGQFKNLYIFCQTDENLIVIDQHAAHERLLYEKFHQQFLQGKIVGQSLLFPETVELSPFQIELVENNKDELDRMGFSVSEFGGNSYVISSVPAIAGQRPATEIFFDVLDGFGSEHSGRSPGGKLDNILATMACKAAIKSGEPLTGAEINELLDQMARADLFSHCPHGRPVVKKISPDEIKKWFSRT